MVMNNFFIFANSMKDPDFAMSGEVAAFLRQHGKNCAIGSDATQDIPADTDCVLVLGGDGTVLQASYMVMERNTPLLGINLGTLGYLAQIEKKEWKKALLKVLNGEYTIENRMMLEGEMPTGTSDFALNDVVFNRSGPLTIMNLNVYVNGHFLNSFNADGIILSTPTGSTAYNLSAGGPIIEPGAQMIVLTPICPHTLNSRSVVLSGEDIVEIEIGRTSTAKVLEAEVSFDGSRNFAIKTGERVRIHRAQKVTRLVRLDQRSFLETLHRKMANVM